MLKGVIICAGSGIRLPGYKSWLHELVAAKLNFPKPQFLLLEIIIGLHSIGHLVK